MRVLVIGAGVIGTVYGAQLAAAGHPVSVLRHGPRTDEIARLGLVARDGEKVRFTPPALAAVIVDDTDAARRARVHAALAEAALDPIDALRYE